MTKNVLDERELAVLGLSPNSRWEEVQAAYRRLAMELHPDRVEGRRGRPSESAGEAEAGRFREINEAYERLRRRHAEMRLRSAEHIEKISEDPAATTLSVDELELRLRYSSSPQLRAAAAMVLGRRPGERSRLALKAACGDPDRQVREAAVRALGMMTGGFDLLRARAASLLHRGQRERRS